MDRKDLASETFSSGISVQAALEKDPLSCGGKYSGRGYSLCWVRGCRCAGSCWNPDVRDRSIFWGTAHQCCLHAPEIKDSKSKPGSKPKLPEDHRTSHVRNLIPNLHALLVYVNPSFPEDAVPSLILSSDGLHLPKWKPQFHSTRTKSLDAAITQVPALCSPWF